MINKVLKFIEQHNMLETGDNVLVGVSGGADSVCLLFMLLEIKKQIPIQLFTLHVNHQLRGQEAKEDEQFVQRLCLEKNLPFKAVAYDVKNLAAEQGISTEEAGRKARYELFEQYSMQWGCNKVAVAHHQNDSAETILLNLFRGSGLKGIAGIEPVRGNIIRPLLCVSRKEIEEYLYERKIEYRIDSSNLEENYTRNKIRNHLLPYVAKEINSGVVEHIIQAGTFIREANDYFDKISEKIFMQYAVKEKKMVILNLECINSTEFLILSYVIRKCIQAVSDNLKDISNIHIEGVHRLCSADTGKSICLPYGIIVERSYGKLIFREQENVTIKAEEWYQDIKPPCKIETNTDGVYLLCTILERKKIEIIQLKMYTKWIDYDRINFTLQIRHRRTGDYITINKSGGRKKLKDYFIDEKIEQKQRDSILLVADGSEIVWVVGYRLSEAYKVTEDTKKVLEMRICGG